MQASSFLQLAGWFLPESYLPRCWQYLNQIQKARGCHWNYIPIHWIRLLSTLVWRWVRSCIISTITFLLKNNFLSSYICRNRLEGTTGNWCGKWREEAEQDSAKRIHRTEENSIRQASVNLCNTGCAHHPLKWIVIIILRQNIHSWGHNIYNTAII